MCSHLSSFLYSFGLLIEYKMSKLFTCLAIVATASVASAVVDENVVEPKKAVIDGKFLLVLRKRVKHVLSVDV